MKKHDGFKRMDADVLTGNTELLVTKSVSRFARITVESLTTVLKERGIEVFFIAELIGHSSTNTTEDIYAHI